MTRLEFGVLRRKPDDAVSGDAASAATHVLLARPDGPGRHPVQQHQPGGLFYREFLKFKGYEERGIPEK